MPISLETNQYWDVISVPQINQPIELTHFEALRNSIINVFRTPYMDRGATFRPDWGSLHGRWLHEPVDENTAFAIQMVVMETLRKNHPLVRLDPSRTIVAPLNDGAGYYVKIVIDASPYLETAGNLEFNVFKT